MYTPTYDAKGLSAVYFSEGLWNDICCLWLFRAQVEAKGERKKNPFINLDAIQSLPTSITSANPVLSQMLFPTFQLNNNGCPPGDGHYLDSTHVLHDLY